MFEYLKVINVDSVKDGRLDNLGHLNVLCGKNNSGKTTILEALVTSGHFSVGKVPKDKKYLFEVFDPILEGYLNPHPNETKAWLRNYVEVVSDSLVWYSSEVEVILADMIASAHKIPYLAQFHDFSFLRRGIEQIVNRSLANYSSIVIPPKRRFEHQGTINFNTAIEPSGAGVLNRLFFLKNQDLESEEFRRYERIHKVFLEITGCKFNIVPDKNNNIVMYYNVKGNWISANNCGLGLSDLLIIVYFVIESDRKVLLIEEPENHLHAEFQKGLLVFINSVKSKQFIITTHSPVFLDTGLVNSLYYVDSKPDGIYLSNQTSRSEILSSLGLGVSDNIVSDAIVLTEGPTDIGVIRVLLDWLGVLNRFNIRFWPLGGDIMSELDLTVFAETKKVFAIVDNDPGSSVQRTRFVRNCKERQITCCRLERYSIENYFSVDALKAIFGDQIPKKLDALDPGMSVDVQIGFKAKGRTIKSKNVQIIKQMTIQDFSGTDLLSFGEKIVQYLNDM